ncbi:MAG: glycosyltransferase family 9 protein [Spirochaetota bacterium]
MSLFTKPEVERDKIDIHILIRCGIGDTLAYLARLDSLLKVHPNARIYFHVGGFRKIPEMIAELLLPDRRVYGVRLLYGYDRQSPRLEKKVLKKIRSIAVPGDIVESWTPDEYPLRYPLQHPFTPELFPEDHAAADEFLRRNNLKAGEALGIHPITTRGNAGAFDEKRYWPQDKWHALVDYLHRKGERLLLFGAHGEEYGLDVDGQKIVSAQGLPLRTTIALLTRVKGLIGTNSWCWEVTAYSGKPIISLWFTFPQNIRLYRPEKADHTQFFTEKSTSVEEVTAAYERLFLR